MVVVRGPHYRPEARILEREFDVPSSVSISIPVGSLRIVGEAERSRARVHVSVRSKYPDLAAEVELHIATEGDETRLRFTGPFTGAGSTQVSVDVLLLVPLTVEVRALNHLGSVSAYRLGTTCRLRSQLGAVRAELAADWAGADIDVRSSLGDVSLLLPRDLRVRLDVHSFRRGHVEAESMDDGVPTHVRAGVGTVSIRRFRRPRPSPASNL
jgi:hypothetical protein